MSNEKKGREINEDLLKELFGSGRDYDGDSPYPFEHEDELSKEIAKGILFGNAAELFARTTPKFDASSVPFSTKFSDEEINKLREPKERALLEKINEKEEKDMVNHPEHYNKGMLETLEKFMLFFHATPDMIKGALLFNVLRYTDRAEHKWNKEEDESKAKFYLDVFETLFEEEARYYNLYRTFKKGN